MEATSMDLPLRVEGQTLTFDEICELEPAIRRAYNLAKMIGRKRGKPFCANAVWYTIFKPIVSHTIGWQRRPTKPGPIKIPTLQEMSLTYDAEKIRRPLFPEIKIGTSTSKDPRLMTAQAYNLAYDKIYGALPDCRECGCW